MSEERQFPLLGGVGSVPWWVAEQAYMGYASKYGDSQSLERLAERGGFGIEEMDEFFPEWREKASLISRLQAELEKHRWIPVDERLPEKEGVYLILIGGTYFTRTAFVPNRKPVEWFVMPSCNVTHWRPITLPLSRKGSHASE